MPETTVDKIRYIRKTVDACNSKLAEISVTDKQLYSFPSDTSNLCYCQKKKKKKTHTHKC